MILFFLLFACMALGIFYIFRKKVLMVVCWFITKKIGFSASISGMAISVKGIHFKQVVLDKAVLHLEIDCISFGLCLQRQFLSVHMGNLRCNVRRKGQSSTAANDTHTNQAASPAIKNILERLASLLAKQQPKVLAYTRVRIDHLYVFDQDHTEPKIVITQLVYKKQQLVFELYRLASLQSKYLVRINYNNHKILYALTNLSPNLADPIQAERLKGKIAIVARQQFTFSAYASGNVRLNHQKIASQPLTLKGLNGLLVLDQFEDRIELNPDSTFQLNGISLEMKGRYNYEEDLCSLLLYLNTQVEDLINLIPNLEANLLKGFKSEGQICIGISLGFLWDDPLHYKFDLDYGTADFKILDPGVNLSYLQSDFSFKPTINSANHRLINVVKLNGDNENDYLLAKIIQLCEDPNFYRHNGVDNYFVGVAIANNLAKKQFYKGASTLSMQLVKNLFLGEEKSLARKLEELVLTLLMENYFNIPKERILAIYLQVIELGPDIYGIQEAAKFYFNKPVVELNLLECLVISYIIPRPRFFLPALLAKSEQLDHNLSKHIENKLKMLGAKRMLSNDELLSIGNKIEFYNIGQFELINLNTTDLANLVARSN